MPSVPSISKTLPPTHSSSHLTPIRILHVLGSMQRGGVETWLMHVLHHIDRDRFQMDFLVHTTQPCAYDDEIRALGSRIIPCLHPFQPLRYAKNFKRILREYGPYDIVHSHVHHYSGYILYLAALAEIPVRIAHSHNDTSSAEAQSGMLRQAYLNLMKRWIQQYATLGLACSKRAATDLFGVNWASDSRWKVLYYGVDLAPFQPSVDSSVVRTELGIPLDAFVIGHVGRFAEQKNHLFLLEIAAMVAQKVPSMHLLLVGEGPLRPAIEQKVAQLGLVDQVTFTGTRGDVQRLMLGAMDVFLFPSLHEGLGLVLVEAQAAGLPCTLSDVVPTEADIIVPLMQRLSLSEAASVWAEKLLTHFGSLAHPARLDAFAHVENSPFNIQAQITELQATYQLTHSYCNELSVVEQ